MIHEFNILDDNEFFFKKSVRYFLSHTSLVQRKEPELFAFISEDSNYEELRTYFAMMNYDFVVSPECAYIKPLTDDLEGKDACIVRFKKEEIRFIVVLWLMLIEKIERGEELSVTMGELTDRISAYKLEVSQDKRKLNPTMKLLKNYNLIDYKESDKGEDKKIYLNPYLQFGWDISQLQNVVDEYSQLLGVDKAADERAEGDDNDE